MSDATVTQRFAAWFTSVLATRDALQFPETLDDALWRQRECWLDLCGSILGHREGCSCGGCSTMQLGEWNAHQAAQVALDRYDAQMARDNG